VDKANWLEVSLTVNGELAEAVSDVLARYAINGVVVESGVIYNDSEDVGTPFGPVRVYGYVPIDEHIEDTRQRIAESLWYLSRIQPLPDPVFKVIEDQNWMEAWKDHYRPIPIGERLLVLPAWIEPENQDRIVIKIDPSMAFGTGTHPTTQLCLEMVERYQKPGVDVIDLGCGSGILSIAAVKLSAGTVLAVDIDEEAVRVTHENADRNGVDDQIEVGLGSVDEIRQGKFSIRQAPLVLANILAPIIIRLFEAGLGDLTTPGGTLILSGILAEQAARVEAAAQQKGYRLTEQRQIGDWVVMVMNRTPAA
jgi:ribosomal protein L11 methyltransferase